LVPQYRAEHGWGDGVSPRPDHAPIFLDLVGALKPVVVRSLDREDLDVMSMLGLPSRDLMGMEAQSAYDIGVEVTYYP
jgi:hypothetical protein